MTRSSKLIVQSHAFRWYAVTLGLLALFSTATVVALKLSSKPLSAINTVSRANPLAGKQFYTDTTRHVNLAQAAYLASGDKTSADVLQKISSRPGAIWLTGPTALDPTASQDIATVLRTSGQAALDKTVPVYQLYAIPYRDACSGYSKNGFTTSDAYLEWVNKILVSLKNGAVFSVEPDAIAQSIGKTCLSSQQVSQRYATLRATVEKLQVEPKVLATYLDAGHSEWFADPKTLVAPLLASGIKMADGVAVNVSFFVATPDITSWSQRLVADLGGNKGVIIDTSRNGNGVPPRSAVGEARWCNPANRALGIAPTTSTGRDKIDAFYYAKTIGESDGACFGHAPAGTFELNSALELARNSHV